MPPTAVAPGADQTSVQAVVRLNAASEALAAQLNHASALREAGGQSVIDTAKALVAQDEANASAIAGGTSAPVVSAVRSAGSVPAAPPVAAIPPVPTVLAPMPGEDLAKALYSGPGASSVHEVADAWSAYGDHLAELARNLTSTGKTIDASWDHGQQQAGANTTRHAQWAAQMSEQAHMLAAHARTVAEGYDTAKAHTPSPAEFAQTRRELEAAMNRFRRSRGANAAEVQQLTNKLATQQAEATAAVGGYHGQVTSASFMSGGLKTAPPITTGGGDKRGGDGGTGGGLGPDKAKDPEGDGGAGGLGTAGSSSGGSGADGGAGGTKHGGSGDIHKPYIAGPGGLGPANLPDSPPWMEIGHGSGNWVRSDDLPSAVVKAPGELGPSPFYDTSGNPNTYMELVPRSGVWVLPQDFPGAQFLPPNAMGPYGWEEYLPGSGIWLPSGELIPNNPWTLPGYTGPIPPA
ncbi:PPE domain-containing protein [Mycolicibacter sinensis]|nr:PPE domain-containing protein [Mycolicibacter sinensis]